MKLLNFKNEQGWAIGVRVDQGVIDVQSAKQLEAVGQVELDIHPCRDRGWTCG